MMCPKCFAPYVEGIETCSDCGIKLVNDFEINKEKKEESDFVISEDTEPVFLVHIIDGIEVERVVEMLESSNIPVLVKRPNVISQIIFQGVRSNADLYVPRAAINDALNIINYDVDDEVNEDN